MEQGGASEAMDDPGPGAAEPELALPRTALEPEDEAVARRAEDHALIRRAQQGDEAAFAGLVERHRTRAWRVARGLVGSDEDAQDLVQEAFLRVFRSLASFDFEHGFTTWLYRIVTNLAIDHLRKRRAAISTTGTSDEDADLDLPDEHGAGPSATLEHDDLAREVQACLASLAPHFQSVLQLREMEGLPCTEIARIVGATHVTVRWRLHRGRKLFQEEWERRARLRGTAAGQRLASGNWAAEVRRDATEADGANKTSRSDVRSTAEDQEEALE
ncbi:MAG TPA: sigma-70 family RNA polymerase sigma factor [Planctomycetota bacterium]|jgi:RNA polymerase sigma-70 factor (ECF subfamily)|nr:sigma-70 family RNA polymerase sigma factor [Planctomycetota bacterium]